MLRAVIDTNVFVSGLLSRAGAPAQVLDAWRERRFVLVSSPSIVAEVRAVLQDPRLRKKYPLADEEVDQVLALIERDGLLVQGEADVAGSLPADPRDAMFLACALDGKADVILSGDHHLLDLGSFQEIPILSARQFLERLGQD